MVTITPLSRHRQEYHPRVVITSLLPKNDRRSRSFSTRNSTHSALLRLPAEIRNQIWEVYLRHVRIHVLWMERKRLRRCVFCGSGNTRYADHMCPYGPIRPVYGDGRTWFPTKNSHESFDFRVLRTCRQLRHEVGSLVLANAQFQFDSPYAFFGLFKHLDLEHKATLTNMHIHASVREIDNWDFSETTRLCWNRVLHSSLLDQLTSLKRVHILIMSAKHEVTILNQYGELGNLIIRGFLRFRTMNLESAAVKVRSEVGWMNGYHNYENWVAFAESNNEVGQVVADEIMNKLPVSDCEPSEQEPKRSPYTI